MSGARFRTVTLDLRTIQQWYDWLALGEEDRLTLDLEAVLAYPERCQPKTPSISLETRSGVRS